MTEPTRDELAIFNEISMLGKSLWDISTSIQGLSTDPKMYSIMLYSRLWSNQRGYTLLQIHNLYLEASIVLRSALEAAICLAANMKLKDKFITLMIRDSAYTVQSQIKMHRSDGDNDLAEDGEAHLHFLRSLLPQDVRPANLNWKQLAELGGVPHLYGYHKMLSGLSSHVTGFSILRGVSSNGMDEGQKGISDLERKMHPMMMAGAMLTGAMCHSIMIGADAELATAVMLTGKLDNLHGG